MMSRSVGALSLVLAFALTLAAQARQQASPQAPPAAQPKTESQAQSLTSEKDQRSYALGMDLGSQLRNLGVDVDPSVFAKGLADALAGGQTRLTPREAKEAINRLQVDLKQRQMVPPGGSASVEAETNRKAGEAFLAANAKRDGVVTRPSGLQYQILVIGSGNKPTLADTVVCQYRGTLIDGTEFDSSYARGQPATFPVRGVIAGWTEALQLMPVGSKWQVFVPGALAYGERGAGGKIGPNATLIFEIELVSIK